MSGRLESESDIDESESGGYVGCKVKVMATPTGNWRWLWLESESGDVEGWKVTVVKKKEEKVIFVSPSYDIRKDSESTDDQASSATYLCVEWTVLAFALLQPNTCNKWYTIGHYLETGQNSA